MSMESNLKATEFRIGNKLQKETGEIFTVLRLDNTDDVLVEEQRGLLTLGYNLFGIPLTEEWLLKFGFEKINHRIEGIIYKKSWLRFNEYARLIDWRGGSIESKVCFYVHQLQNLYFALTGEELTLNTSGE